MYLYTCKFYYCCLFPTAASDVCEAASTCAECESTTGIVVGVVVVSVVLILALTVIVIIVLVLRTFRGYSKTKYVYTECIIHNGYLHNCAGKGLVYLQLLTRQ